MPPFPSPSLSPHTTNLNPGNPGAPETPGTSEPHPDAIAETILNAFAALPQKFKPRYHHEHGYGKGEGGPRGDQKGSGGQVGGGETGVGGLGKGVGESAGGSGKGEGRVREREGAFWRDGWVEGRVASRREWVPLAGVVVCRDGGELHCVALATGMKCLPVSKVALAEGNVLHDSHAEILALRGFNRWVLDECRELAEKGVETGEWVERTGAQLGDINDAEANEPPSTRPFKLRRGVTVHMYCSQTPCGDASMELTMASQADATPWLASPSSNQATDSEALPGRAGFANLGIVRRKPARPDAPPTLSKSCSDKLALKQFTGLLNGVVSLLLDPIFLASLVLPKDQLLRKATSRAWGRDGRLAEAVTAVGRHGFRAFEVRGTSRVFGFSKKAVIGTAAGAAVVEAVPSNLSALATTSRKEVLINGVLQGRKFGDVRGASCVSRRGFWEAVGVVAGLLGVRGILGRRVGDYKSLKGCLALRSRRDVKRVVREKGLRGWVRNEGDEGWGIG